MFSKQTQAVVNKLAELTIAKLLADFKAADARSEDARTTDIRKSVAVEAALRALVGAIAGKDAEITVARALGHQATDQHWGGSLRLQAEALLRHAASHLEGSQR